MRQDQTQALLPPRPNPGPEPWPGADGPPQWGPLSILGIGGLAALLLAGWLLRRRRGRRAVGERTVGAMAPLDDTPRGQLLRLADDVRRSLSRHFGPAMRARTTEEIAADVAIREALGPERFEGLLRLLGQADRWKFAPRPQEADLDALAEELPLWDELAAALNGPAPLRREARSGRPSG